MQADRHSPTVSKLVRCQNPKGPCMTCKAASCAKHTCQVTGDRIAHNVCIPKSNKQQPLCAAARHRRCPHRPSSSQSTCHMHHSQRQYSSCQSDKAPTYSNSELAKPMALSLEGWGETVFRHREGGREGWWCVCVCVGGHWGLGQRTRQQWAQRWDETTRKSEGASINHQSIRAARIYRDLKKRKQGTGSLPTWHVSCTCVHPVVRWGKTTERKRVVKELVSRNYDLGIFTIDIYWN